MSTETEKELPTANIVASIYGDVLADKTLRFGKTLFIASSLCIVVKSFGINAHTSAFLPIDLSTHPGALTATLSAATAVFFARYLVRALNDYFKAKETAIEIARFVQNERIRIAADIARSVDQAQADAEAADRHAEQYGFRDDWWEEYEVVRDDAQKRLQALSVGDRRPAIILWYVRGILEGIPPILCAVLAMYMSWQDFITLLSKIIAKL